MNKRLESKASTRLRVLSAAALLFEEVGYEAATIRKIAKGAGMSTGAVFANFRDKADLFFAIYGIPPICPVFAVKIGVAALVAELSDADRAPTPRERAVSMLRNGASFDHAATALGLSVDDLDVVLCGGVVAQQERAAA